jgi:hypothetical protein
MAVRYAASASDGFPVAPQQHTEIAVGIRVARVDGDRTLVGVDRLFQLADRLEDDAQIAVAICTIRLERWAPLDERDRFVASPLLMREDTGREDDSEPS